MAVVAVSRQVGSYGNEIMALSAQLLGYKLIDREEVHALAEKCDDEFKKACALYEREIPKDFWERHFLNTPTYTSLFASLNFELASEGDVVIAGRGAQIVLGRFPGVYKVRVVAPEELRVERMMEKKNLPWSEAESFVRSHGHGRRTLIQSLYHKDLSDWSLYDLIINTEFTSIEGGAKIIQSAVEVMPPVTDPEGLAADFRRQAFAKKVESWIRKKVREAFHRHIDVSCPADGVILLTGFSMDAGAAEAAEEVARSFDEVHTVTNEIKIFQGDLD